MLVPIFGKVTKARQREHAHDPARRGYHIAYRENQVNHCPGCGRSQWYIGRLTAECGFCGTALPLVQQAHNPFRSCGNFYSRTTTRLP